MFTLRGQGSDLADGGFDRKKVLVANIVSEEARHRAKRAGMGVRRESWAVEGHLWGVEADAGPGLY